MAAVTLVKKPPAALRARPHEAVMCGYSFPHISAYNTYGLLFYVKFSHAVDQIFLRVPICLLGSS